MTMIQLCKMDVLVVSMILMLWLTPDLHASMVPCSTEQYQGQKLPTLPDHFTVEIEATIVQKNYSMNMKEYYDYPNNRVMIERYDQMGEKVRVVTDLEDQTSHVYYMNQTCTVLPISSNQAYGFMVGSNGSHVKSVKDLLHFGDDMGEQYIGQDMVRGIVANHWRACVKLPKSNGTFNIDYYFSKSEDYRINGMLKTVPLRAVLNGTAKAISRNGSVTDNYHSFYHVYEFIDFQPGPIRDKSVFEIPVGTYCKNSIHTKPMPLIPDQFTVTMEAKRTVLNGNAEMQYQQIFYDGPMKLIRVDESRPMTRQQRVKFGNQEITEIVDYTTNLKYTIDKWEQNCTVTMVTGSPSMRPDPMFQPGHFLDIFKGNFTYQGQKTVRGIKTESWALLNQTSKIITEIFFHKVDVPQGPVNLGFGKGGSNEEPFINYQLVGINKRPLLQATGEDSGEFMHMFNFMGGHPDPEVYDVSPCYSMGHHYSYMAFKTEGNYMRDVYSHRKEFTSAVRSAIARGAKVSGTRVTSILIEEEPSNINQVRVYFKILDNQLASIKSTLAGPSLATAKQTLQQSVSGGLNFDVQYTTIEKNFQVISDTLWETMSSDMEPQQSTVTHYSAGSMAGIGIGMLVVGALLGLLAAFVIYKRVDSSVPYQITK